MIGHIVTLSQKQRLSDSMSAFKRYVEVNGDTVTNVPEFVNYFALPFIPNPASHPAFTALFTV